MPLYDSLGETAVEYTVNHSATALVFVQASKLALLAKAAPKVKDSLRAVVVWGGADAAAEAAVRKEARARPAQLAPVHTTVLGVDALLK